MIPFVLVTQSKGKLREIERIVGYSLEHSEIDLIEIQSVEVEEVVGCKVRLAYERLGKPVMVEDTGLHIKAWEGLPGALIKWFVQRVGELGICRMMSNYSDRTAWAKTVVATYDGCAAPRLYVGRVEGQIAFEPAGAGGFGWDKVFIPDGATKSFGEMFPEEKDAYSMRRQALAALMAQHPGR